MRGRNYYAPAPVLLTQPIGDTQPQPKSSRALISRPSTSNPSRCSVCTPSEPRALDYSLRRWAALTRFIDDGRLPVDNNWIENQIRPIAIGRNNWLFAGSLRAGRRTAAVMSLIQSAKLNGHEPHAYLRDVLARLPTQRANRIDELLPHRWCPGGATG